MGPDGFDPEWSALTLGIKPALRRTAAPDEADALAARLVARGARVVRADGLARVGGRDVAVLYAARALADAEALRDAEAPVLPGRGGGPGSADAHREVGRRLGFPGCCVDAFCARIVRGVDALPHGPRGLAEDYVALRDAWVARPDPRLNNLLMPARWQLVAHYPCRYDCAWSRRYADALLDALARRDPAAAQRILGALSRAVVVAPDGARAVVTLADAHITLADAPRDPSGRAVSPRDEALARALPGAAVGPDGAVTARDAGPGEPAWAARFDAF